MTLNSQEWLSQHQLLWLQESLMEEQLTLPFKLTHQTSMGLNTWIRQESQIGPSVLRAPAEQLR